MILTENTSKKERKQKKKTNVGNQFSPPLRWLFSSSAKSEII